MSRPRIGAHLPIKHGLHEALLLGAELDCDAVQLFSRNPRGWVAKPLTPESIELFRKARKETKISPVLKSSIDRKSTRLNSSHVSISYAVFCLKKKRTTTR